MDSQLPYWTAFNHIPGVGTVRMGVLVDYFGTPEDAWNSSEEDLRHCGLTGSVVDSIIRFRANADPVAITESILNRHISICLLSDPEYPRLLKDIDHPPLLLYYVGKLPAPDEKLMAMVGTRRMTSYGQKVADELSSYMASAGVGIVSGLARGVDGVSHAAALRAGGKTYGVLACGVDTIYPPEHRNLAKAIVGHGAILSEYPPGTRPDKTNFPQRNRIISGMCSGIVVVEAGEKSGTLITARFAAEQGREVFAVPGKIDAPQSRGTNGLICNGARPLYDKKELLDFLGTWQAETPEKPNRPIQMAFASPEEQQIIDLIANEPLHVDDIARETGIPVAKVSSMMILLEVKNFVTEVGPQMYEKNHTLY